MSVGSPDRVAHSDDDARGSVERIPDVGAEVQQLSPADPVMIQPFFIGKVIGKKIVIVLIAVSRNSTGNLRHGNELQIE